MSYVPPWSDFIVISYVLSSLKTPSEKGRSLVNGIQVVHVSHPVSLTAQTKSWLGSMEKGLTALS